MLATQIDSLKIEGEEIEQIEETHISYVLLTKDHAYKIKKTIRFSFLDFSSLEDRQYYCERELELNRRLTKGIYLAVVAVRDDEGAIGVGSPNGVVIDYALKMRRMQSNRQMHLLLEQDQVSSQQIIALARMVANFHSKAVVLRHGSDTDQLRDQFNDLLSVRKVLVGVDGDGPSVLNDMVTASNSFLLRHAQVFADRIQNGMIRDCHGDLHSRNIFLEEHPIIFDCIEFSDAFRAIDVIDEVAFFCMDLEVEGRADLAEIFMEEYLNMFPKALESDSDWQLFRYYKLYRANVRLKVTALQLKETGQSAREDIRMETKKYLQLCQAYLQNFS